MAFLILIVLASFGFGAEPPFPPGVVIPDEITNAAKLPPGVEAFALEVDWTNPRLTARIEFGIELPGDSPRRWDRIAPDALKIQIAQPRDGEEGWEIWPPVSRKKNSENSDKGSPRLHDLREKPNADRVRIGGVPLWAFAGPTAERDDDPPATEIEPGTEAQALWLGHPADWKSNPPDILLGEDPWFLSVFDSATGISTFYLLLNTTDDEYVAKNLETWIEAEFQLDHLWLALHHVGPQVIVGMGEWRLGQTDSRREPTAGKIERAGAVLILEEAGPNDLVDWARIEHPAFSTSSTHPEYAEDNLVGGLLWPQPLHPRVWMSGENLEADKENATVWLEMRLPDSRPVSRINIIYAGAAGWSDDFNPGALRVWIKEKERAIFPQAIEFNDIGKPMSSLRFPDPKMISEVRIEFIDPSRNGNKSSPARLAAIQLWGPLGEE